MSCIKTTTDVFGYPFGAPVPIEITDEMVERAAQEMYERDGPMIKQLMEGLTIPAWNEIEEIIVKKAWLTKARLVLEAAINPKKEK